MKYAGIGLGKGVIVLGDDYHSKVETKHVWTGEDCDH